MYSRLIYLVFLQLFLFQGHQSLAQFIGLSASRGPVLDIYPEFPISSGAQRLSIEYGLRQNDTTLWNRAFHHPITSIKLSYMDLGNASLGEAIGLQYQFIKDLSITKKLSFHYGLALGVVYFNNPYHYEDNPENIANGSSFAFLPELILGLNHDFNENLSLATTFNFYHSSNGHSTLPNVGINVPSYQLGLYYRLNGINDNKPTEVLANEWLKKWHLNGRFSLGLNEFGGSTAPTNGPKNLIYLTSLYASKRYSPKGFFQMGIDAYYNTGYRNYIISQELEQRSSLKDNFVDASALLIFIGHEYIYGHYGMVIQAGYNIHNPYLKYRIEVEEAKPSSAKAKIPGKFGVKYYLKNPYRTAGRNLSVGLFIKSNTSQADFLEMGIGWRL